MRKIQKQGNVKRAEGIANCLVIECPYCGRWLASCSTCCTECLPNYSYCKCDEVDLDKINNELIKKII